MKKEIKEAMDKFLETFDITVAQEMREIALSNAHPLVLKVHLENDPEIAAMITDGMQKKSDFARNKILEMIVLSRKLSSLMMSINKAVLNEFGNELAAEEFAIYYMNQTKERLVAIFTKPFILKDNEEFDFFEAKRYIETLETYQTASLLVDFATKFGQVAKEMELEEIKIKATFDRNTQNNKKNTAHNKKPKNIELINLMKKYNLNQREVAEALNTHQAIVSRWVNGEKMPLSINEIEQKISNKKAKK